jgi:outer membrane lipoprotein-sorting protein
MIAISRLFAAACIVLASTVAPAAEPAILAKARAYLGSEAALNNLKSVHYTGMLVMNDPADPKKQTRAAMEIIFQRPEQQRIVAKAEKITEVTALDGYDGWQRVQENNDTNKWKQTLLGTDQIKRLRANTWENLAFFRGIEKIGGQLEDQGPKTIDGVACQKIAFIHAPNIIFYRYFDVATGRLLLTETEAGGTIREQGEVVISGIKFPKTLVTTTKNAKGETQTVTIDFDKVTVNETFPSTMFSVPGLGSK